MERWDSAPWLACRSGASCASRLRVLPHHLRAPLGTLRFVDHNPLGDVKAANADAAVCARDGNVDSQTDGIHGVRDQHTIRSRRIFGLTALSALMLGFWAGCVPDPGFELDSFHPSSNQRLIARYYEDEALRLRQQAEEFEARAEMYERTFGPDSDWVTSAKLLAQSYRLAADDRERLAKEHLEAGRDHRSPTSLRQQTSSERTP